jgi:hypothetical protein
MKRILISFISLFIAVTALYPRIATVNDFNAKLTSEDNGGDTVEVLQLGAKINIIREGNISYLVSYERTRGWIKKSSVVQYPQRFSNVDKMSGISSKIYFENGNYYLPVFHNERLHKLNVDTLEIEASQRIDNIVSIYPSPNNEVFLINGVFNEEGIIHNFAIYNFINGRTTFLGSFAEDKLILEKVSFSADASHVAIRFRKGQAPYLAVFSVDNGKLVAFDKQSDTSAWYNNSLIMNNNSHFWKYDFKTLSDAVTDISYTKEREILPVRRDWVVGNTVESEIFGSELYINAQRGVVALNLDNLQISSTPFQSLNIDVSRTLNFYTTSRGSFLRNVLDNTNLRNYSGANPRNRFVRFVGNNILYRRTIDKIETLFMEFTGQDKEDYKFKTIEEPSAYSENGILAEIAEERDKKIILIENPNIGKFNIIPLGDR